MKQYILDNMIDKKGILKSACTKWDGLWIKNNNSELFEILMNNAGRTISEKIYLYMNDLEIPPLCEYCNENYKSFITYKKGYTKFCSPKCSNSSEETQKKMRESCFKHFGTYHQSQSDTIKKKSKQTCLEKYCVEHPMQLSETKEKIKQTCLERYGTNHAMQSNIVKEKVVRTFKENHFDIFLKQLELKKLIFLSSKENYINNDICKYKCLNCETEFESETQINLIQCQCNAKKILSNKELELYNWLKSLELIIEKNKRTIIYPYELDIYIKEHNLAIEFNGLYWHSELHKDKLYHLNKTVKCNEKDIQLIHIFENEWDQKQNIVKSIILSKLGLCENKIHARKCLIKEISTKEYRSFVELNHIQGYAAAKIRLGLFYNNELVQICSFGKSRFKKNETELIRSCSKLNYQIIGGFNKLIKYYVSEYKPEVLISYVDRRYFNGKGYKDWTLIEKTKPNYWYVKDQNIYNRITFQKYKLNSILDIYDENLSELENMLINRYYRIWDCGNLKFRYNLCEKSI